MHSKMSLDVEGNSKKLGTNVLQYTNNKQENQQWQIKVLNNGYCNIISKSCNLYLDIPYSEVKNGANVQVWSGNGGKNQMFKFERIDEENKPSSNIITGTKTIEDGAYTIKTALNENAVIEVYDNSKADGANIELWKNNNTNNQKFNIKYLGNGCYTISVANSNKNMDVAGNEKKLGTNVLQWTANGEENQQWIIKDAGNGYYNIISKSSGLYIDIPYSETKNGTNVQIWKGNNGKNQQFKFEKTKIYPEGNQTLSDGVYTIKTALDENKAFDITSASKKDGESLIVYNSNGESNQRFNVKHIGFGDYEISVMHSGSFLDINNRSTTNGTKVVQWTRNNAYSQRWLLQNTGDGYYNIISKESGLYITIIDGKAYTYEKNNEKNQKFKFTNSNSIPNINESQYPGYKEKLQILQAAHPNWNFKLLYTGLTFDEVVRGECSVHARNLVPTNYGGEWVCSVCGTKLYDSGWYCASEKAVAYYMDPRNFLDENNVFQFLDLNDYASDSVSLEGIQSKVSGTFLQNYANDINNACKNTKVNPYYIISRLIQEQGSKGTTIGTGMDGGDGKLYYNPFNIGASGNGYDEIYSNALATAKSYGWDSMQKAIEGGISFCKKNWLENYQNTLYQNKFDIDTTNGSSLYTHQYMQNLMAAYSEAKTLRSMYASTGKVNSSFTFVIPVYEKMSSTIAALPSNNSETSTMNFKVVANGGLNLRNEASTDSGVIKLVPNGEIVLSIQRGINSNWQKVMLNDGTIGYMSGTYLQQVADVTNCNYAACVKTADGSGCYIRVGPSTKTDRITALADGTWLTVINEGTYNNIDGYNWVRVLLSDGRQAFMPSKFLSR